ncbi:MAG: hypothetical protein M1817_001104 [Caeruleum heppii]|nr:MAG: hypothetical protein M1817_001104 [Caeruleum heppii]
MATPPPYPDENQGPRILAVCVTTTVLAFVIVCLRLFTRIKVVRSVGWDDYVILLTMAVSIAGLAVIIPEIQHGGGRHAAYLAPEMMSVGIKLNFITQPIYLWGIALAKISISLFLLRLTPVTGYQRFLWGLITFMLVYTSICFLTINLQCRPISFLWKPTIKAKCFSGPQLRALSYLNVVINILTDLILAFIPIPMLWNVQMSRQTKIALTAIMSIGIFACVAACIKSVYIVNYGKTGDFLWDSAGLTIWTVTECNLGIIAASLPPTRPLFKAFFDGTFFSRGTQRRHKHSYRMGNTARSRSTPLPSPTGAIFEPTEPLFHDRNESDLPRGPDSPRRPENVVDRGHWFGPASEQSPPRMHYGRL